MSTTGKILPCLKSCGGKGKFTSKIEEVYRKANSNQWLGNQELQWVDPFCGGLAVPLAIQPKKVIINDLNPYLINFYNHIKNHGNISLPLVNEEEYFYKIRDLFNQNIIKDWHNVDINSYTDKVKSDYANWYYLLNRSGFNGLMRFNKSGKFNTPFGHYKYPNYKTEFYQHKELFKDWTITQGDWRKVLEKYNKDTDFLMLDPTYDTIFKAYTPDGFNWDDQVELAHAAAKHAGPVLAFNQATDRVIDLYTSLGFNIEYTYREDKINSHRPKNNKVKEMFATIRV